MNEKISRRRSQRTDLNPPEVGVLFVKETGHVSGTTLAPPPRKIFVDLMNRSAEGVGIKTQMRIEPATVFYLGAFNTTEKTLDFFEGQTKWIKPDSDNGLRLRLGAELKPAQMTDGFFKEENNHGKITPVAADYQFFRNTDLLKSIARDAVCPLLNCITFRQVRAGQRFMRQGEPGDDCYIIQKGICVINVEKRGELIPVARLREGDVVGEMALITGESRSAHVDAETDMQLWCLTKAQFDQISEVYPDLRSFLTDLVTRWFETRTVTAEREIGKYLITDIIGSGGYSIVYRGVHEALNMPVAIKMMKHDLAMRPDFIKNFRNEARTIAKFNHENIVHVYDIEERYKTLFIIMEHLEGMSLRTLLKRMLKLPPLQVIDYLLQICAGLQYAHTKDVVHQDIKPGNIYILPDEKVKILDFGLASPCGRENHFTGTPFYMAPEQIDCLPVDYRTDIFALGLMTYEMLTGRRPFAEEDAWEVMDLRLKQDIPDPKEAVPDLPEPLRKFVLKACARDASQRYQDVSEIIDELKSLTDKLGLRKQEISRERRKIATMFLMYKEEHQPELNRMMQDFCEKVNDLGVSCKAADFKEI
ncbi:MAG: protein kinase [Deltaproteobacteria bacterium]|jgi:serine/threonine protein kinase|nr:protein kinase [Deltaproteobacteria bacterium]